MFVDFLGGASLSRGRFTDPKSVQRPDVSVFCEPSYQNLFVLFAVALMTSSLQLRRDSSGANALERRGDHW
jgi:hypothetical protein